MITENDINNAAKDYCNKRYPASQDAPFYSRGILGKVLHGLLTKFLRIKL